MILHDPFFMFVGGVFVGSFLHSTFDLFGARRRYRQAAEIRDEIETIRQAAQRRLYQLEHEMTALHRHHCPVCEP